MTQLPSATSFDLELHQNWLTIWFNRPEARNAMDARVLAELTGLFHMLQNETPAVRGISLRGRGGVFCAGGDLQFFKNDLQANGKKEDIITASKNIAALFQAVHTAPQFVIAFIEGAAMAGGFGLACCADAVLCTGDAKFAMTELMLGLSPAQIAPYVIRRLGAASARRLLLTAARFDGQEARTLGFADFVAPDVAQLEAIEKDVKRQVLACAPLALAATKDLLHKTANMDIERASHIAAENFYERIIGEESREGIAAFFAKRKPNWTIEPE